MAKPNSYPTGGGGKLGPTGGPGFGGTAYRDSGNALHRQSGIPASKKTKWFMNNHQNLSPEALLMSETNKKYKTWRFLFNIWLKH